MSNAAPSSAGGAVPGNNFTGSQQPASTSSAAPTTSAAASSSGTASNNQNLNQIVTDYLLKKGYRRTEEIFRQEVKDIDENGKPKENGDGTTSAKSFPAGKYLAAFKHFDVWVQGGLEVYKFELKKFLWPLFIYSYLRLVKQGSSAHAHEFMEELRGRFEKSHPDEVKTLATITLPPHVQDAVIATTYLSNQYSIPLSKSLAATLFSFLEREYDQGGGIIIDLITQHIRVDSVDRGPIEPFSFEAIYRRSRQQDLDEVDVQEGIPGMPGHSGLMNRTLLDEKAMLKLGPIQMESELREDVVAELEEEDKLHPPRDGYRSLVEEFNAMNPVKKEAVDSPSEIPYPPSRARDVVMEMQKTRENRDRFKIDTSNGAQGAGVTIHMWTFHNHLGAISCMDFSKDQNYVAVGTVDSYIRVWSVDGKELKSLIPTDKTRSNNRKLFGHSGPVYSVAFSDAITNLDRNIYEGMPHPESKPDTRPSLLLSCSADGQVRLWSLDVWACICIYKGHDGPVYSVSWSPYGHYFLTGGWDKTVRVWSQDHSTAIRFLVGHDTAISAITWHPNGSYVFSASDEIDKSIRMWAVQDGQCVRIFNGHVEFISALECTPNGKILASADIAGNIILWDIEKGTRIKRCRGHGRGGIWSLSFCVESTVLASAGQDCTVRLWDVEMPPEGRVVNQQDGDNINAAGQGDAKQPGQAQSASGAAGTGKKKGKEVMITPDQISAFPTKKTSVKKVQFTRMNLVLAGGCYQPETQDAGR
ncbi:WD40 repeat-like protein [Annulohypoxylon maeteangense]|uniref:WD40 repeat-like protein n=1 Tax=Annulohypoxylon maeteangense TaxID=1927788 RepID=UPI0020076A0D|nr:WD40 repeat-like protein [Annulohypoxylon maeteangense]KAI0884052.1 WD40 repeat-like protein [Annulohypoxylon maeteangense]